MERFCCMKKQKETQKTKQKLDIWKLAAMTVQRALVNAIDVFHIKKNTGKKMQNNYSSKKKKKKNYPAQKKKKHENVPL